MYEVKLSRLMELLDPKQYDELIEMSKESTRDAVGVIHCNSNFRLSSNRVIAGNVINVAELDILAAYYKQKTRLVPIEYGIIRPDVFAYLTSDTKYRPIIEQYSYELPNIHVWNRSTI